MEIIFSDIFTEFYFFLAFYDYEMYPRANKIKTDKTKIAKTKINRRKRLI